MAVGSPGEHGGPRVAGQAVPKQIPINLEDPYTEHVVAAALEAVYLRRSDAIIAKQDYKGLQMQFREALSAPSGAISTNLEETGRFLGALPSLAQIQLVCDARTKNVR